MIDSEGVDMWEDGHREGMVTVLWEVETETLLMTDIVKDMGLVIC